MYLIIPVIAMLAFIGCTSGSLSTDKVEYELVPTAGSNVGASISRKLNDQVTVRTGVNMDLLFLAASAGGGFGKLSSYLSSNDNYGINSSIKNYFGQYTQNENAAALYQAAMGAANPYKKFVSPMLGEIPAYDEASYEPISNDTRQVWKSLKDFAKDSDAQSFFADYGSIYKSMFEDFTGNILKFNHLDRLEDFFGYNMKNDRFVVVISTVMSGGQATDEKSRDGIVTHYSIVNPGDAELDVLYTLYHETSHNFYDVRVHDSELLKKYSQYTDVLGKHERDSGTEFNEVITRAISCLLIEKYHGKQEGQLYLEQMSANGWKGVREIKELIGKEYMPDRQKYKTFPEFTPRIFELLGEMKR